VAGRIFDSEVCLDLGQPHDNVSSGVLSYQQFAQEFARHDLGGTLVEVTLERWGV
jgi:serine protease inhibitor ecotin